MIRDNIIVRLLDLPHTIKGFCSPSPDGTYNIYVNARHTREMQDKTVEHELKHIEECDFETDKSVSVLEKRK